MAKPGSVGECGGSGNVCLFSLQMVDYGAFSSRSKVPSRFEQSNDTDWFPSIMLTHMATIIGLSLNPLTSPQILHFVKYLRLVFSRSYCVPSSTSKYVMSMMKLVSITLFIEWVWHWYMCIKNFKNFTAVPLLFPGHMAQAGTVGLISMRAAPNPHPIHLESMLPNDAVYSW